MSDESPGTIEPWLKQKGAAYAVAVDGGGTSAKYGVSGIPDAFLIGPDGKIVWQGHPSNVTEKEIEAVLQKVCVRFDYVFGAKFKAIEAKVRKKDFGGAAADLAKMADLSGNDAAEAKRISDDLEGFAKDKQAQVEEAAKSREYAEAVEILAELGKQWKGHAVGAAADEKLKGWKADAAIQKELKAGQLFAQGAGLEEKFQFAQAAGLYTQITKAHAGTRAAEKAQEALDRIQKEALLKFDPGCGNCKKAGKTCPKHRSK